MSDQTPPDGPAGPPRPGPPGPDDALPTPAGAPDRPGAAARQVAIHKVELMTPDGMIRGRVQVDMGPMRISDLVPTAFELTQVLGMKAEQRSERLGLKVSCKAGCGACCRQMVPLSPPEAYFMADMLDRMEDLRRARLVGRFEKIEAHLESLNMVGQLLSAESGSSPVRALSRTYFALQMACPFLEDESCSIHPDRPVACRDYSVTSPASFCRDPYTFPVEVVPMPMPLSLALARLFADLTDTEPTLIPLTLAPRWVREHPEWRSSTWPGLELFERFMIEAGGPAEAPPPADATREGTAPPETALPESTSD